MAKNRLPTASLQRPQLPEPIFEPAPFADMTPVPGYSEVPGFTADRTAAIGQVANPEPLPPDIGAVIAQMNSAPAPSPSPSMGGGGLPARADQLQREFQDIRRRGMEAADIEATQKRAELEDWMNKGGLSPNGVYASLKPGSWTAEAQAEVDNFHANQQPAGTMMPNRAPLSRGPGMPGPSPVAQATSSYVPGGISQPPSNKTGVASAIQTGDPFFDVNTDFDRLAKEKAIRDNNDAAFSQGNDARLGDIAGDRQRADAKRAANLAAQGMTQEQIDQRMYPQRFAQPVDPGIAQAKAVDAAERQGRSNLHAIAQKFMRNGLSPAAAYSAAMNVTPTTNPGNMGAVPSLPGLDPMRVIQTSSPGTGMAAAQQSVGTTRADNDLTLGGQQSSDRRYETDSRERVGMANAANGGNLGLMEMLLKLQQQQMNQGVVSSEQNNQARDAALQFIRDPENITMQYGTPDQQAIWNQQMQAARGGGTAAPTQPGPLSGAVVPRQGGIDPNVVNNPIALQQVIQTYPEADRPRQAALLYAQAGVNNPALDNYLLSKYQQDAAYDPLYAAQRAEMEEGFPQEAALRVFQQFYRNQPRQ